VVAVLLSTFIGGVFAAQNVPAIQQVFVTNFPKNQNVTVTNPTTTSITVAPQLQTSSLVIIPYNTTARSAAALFPNLLLQQGSGNSAPTSGPQLLTLVSGRNTAHPFSPAFPVFPATTYRGTFPSRYPI